jgi:hypothetical protein
MIFQFIKSPKTGEYKKQTEPLRILYLSAFWNYSLKLTADLGNLKLFTVILIYVIISRIRRQRDSEIFKNVLFFNLLTMEDIMTHKKDELPDISITSTKKEMLAAFEELKMRFQDQAQTELKPEKKKEEIRKTEAVRTADALTTEGTVTKINELKIEIGKMFSLISEKLEEEAGNYLKLKESIELKKKELKEIYDIEESAYALAALIEAQKQKKQAFEEEMERRKEALDNEINQKRGEWAKERQEHEDAVKERDAEEKKTRQRQKEEFDYNFKWEQQLSTNSFNDEKLKREKELAADKDAFEKKVAETGKNLDEREERIKEREKFVNDLQMQVDQFPARLDAEIKRITGEITDKSTLEAKKNEELLKKEHEGVANVLKTKIESLEKLVTQQNKQIEDLSARLEKSYSKVQDIAVKAIEGSASAQRLSNLEQHLLLERKAKPPQESRD